MYIHFAKDIIKPRMRVLDAGCGAGRYSVEFARLGARIHISV